MVKHVPGEETKKPPDGPIDALALLIPPHTAPELAIKIAYDFARKHRMEGADESEYPALLQDNVERIFSDTTLLRYVRAGFRAGFFSQPLPWRRDIESAGQGQA
jgi:hypothetical protein